MRKREKRAERAGLLFLLPWLIGFACFSLYPILMSAYYSLTDFSAVKAPVFVGMRNYTSLFHDKLFWKSIQNTLYYTALFVPVSISLSLLLALLLKPLRIGKGFFRSVFFLPSIFPAVASTMVWIIILDPLSGYLNCFLKLFGIPGVNWLGDPKAAIPALVLMSSWGIGATIVILLAAMGDIPAELYEAASLDGAGMWRQFCYVTIPGIAHVLLYQIVLSIINATQYFTQVYILCSAQSGNLSSGAEAGRGNSLLMYPLYLFQNAFSRLKMGTASAMAWILFLAVLLFSVAFTRIGGRFVDEK